MLQIPDELGVPKARRLVLLLLEDGKSWVSSHDKANIDFLLAPLSIDPCNRCEYELGGERFIISVEDYNDHLFRSPWTGPYTELIRELAEDEEQTLLVIDLRQQVVAAVAVTWLIGRCGLISLITEPDPNDDIWYRWIPYSLPPHWRLYRGDVALEWALTLDQPNGLGAPSNGTPVNSTGEENGQHRLAADDPHGDDPPKNGAPREWEVAESIDEQHVTSDWSSLSYETDLPDGSWRFRRRSPAIDKLYGGIGCRQVLYESMVDYCINVVSPLVSQGELDSQGWQPSRDWHWRELPHRDRGESRIRIDDLLAELHARWLVSPQPRLHRRSARDVLGRRMLWIGRDLWDRQLQWSVIDECPPTLPHQTAAYRWAGFGPHEVILMFHCFRDLLRYTVASTWMRANWDRETMKRDLIDRIETWLSQTQPEDGLLVTPAQLIAWERERRPWLKEQEDVEREEVERKEPRGDQLFFSPASLVFCHLVTESLDPEPVFDPLAPLSANEDAGMEPTYQWDESTPPPRLTVVEWTMPPPETDDEFDEPENWTMDDSDWQDHPIIPVTKQPLGMHQWHCAEVEWREGLESAESRWEDDADGELPLDDTPWFSTRSPELLDLPLPTLDSNTCQPGSDFRQQTLGQRIASAGHHPLTWWKLNRSRLVPRLLILGDSRYQDLQRCELMHDELRRISLDPAEWKLRGERAATRSDRVNRYGVGRPAISRHSVHRACFNLRCLAKPKSRAGRWMGFEVGMWPSRLGDWPWPALKLQLSAVLNKLSGESQASDFDLPHVWKQVHVALSIDSATRFATAAAELLRLLARLLVEGVMHPARCLETAGLIGWIQVRWSEQTRKRSVT